MAFENCRGGYPTESTPYTMNKRRADNTAPPRIPERRVTFFGEWKRLLQPAGLEQVEHEVAQALQVGLGELGIGTDRFALVLELFGDE